MPCLRCQKPLQGKQRKFCSNACKCSYYHPPKPTITKNCILCGTEFVSKIEHPRYRFCSNKCKELYTKSQETYKQQRRLRAKQYREENLDFCRALDRKRYYKNKSYFYAQNAKRRAVAKQATPKWADMQAIKDVYLEAQYFGYHVDHIVPLRGKNVCGLHVWDNLQLLPADTNLRKGNYHSVYEKWEARLPS